MQMVVEVTYYLKVNEALLLFSTLVTSLFRIEVDHPLLMGIRIPPSTDVALPIKVSFLNIAVVLHESDTTIGYCSDVLFIYYAYKSMKCRSYTDLVKLNHKMLDQYHKHDCEF